MIVILMIPQMNKTIHYFPILPKGKGRYHKPTRYVYFRIFVIFLLSAKILRCYSIKLPELNDPCITCFCRLNSQFGGPLDSPPTSPFANLKSDINNLKKIKVVSPSIPPTQPHNISPLSVSPLTMATDSHTQNPLFTIPTERPLGK